MGGLIAWQPFKALYVLLAVTFELARFPLWIVLYLPAFGRPHKKWSLRQALGMKVTRQFVKHSAAVEVHTPHDLRPGSEKDRFVTYDVAPASTYKGLLVDKEVKPGKMGGTWWPKPITAAEVASGNIDVVCHFHGGAYVIGDGRDADTAPLAKTLLKHAGVTHVFAPNYRLSVVPTGRFPAAFQDAVTSYYYLVKTLKIPADRITFSGDSAGGNLSLAIQRYLVEFGDEVGLPQPACNWLWSPWIDIEAARSPKALLDSPNYWTDYLTPNFSTWGARLFAPIGKGFNPADPYVSPLGSPFKAKTPFWIHTGDAEVLYYDDIKLAEELKTKGNKVDLVVDEAVPHDILLVGHLVGFTEQAGKAAKKAGEFLRANRLTSA